MNNEQPLLDKAQKRFIWKVRKIVIESSPPITERQRTDFMRKWWSTSYNNYTADIARKHLKECGINIDITPIELCAPIMSDNVPRGGDSDYCFANIVAECILFSRTLRI